MATINGNMLFLFCTLISVAVAIPTADEEALAIAAVNEVINQYHLPTQQDLGDLNNNIAPFVRFAFHSCVGGCTGCINMALSDNRGLQKPLDRLNAAYINATIVPILSPRTISSFMSRADFWALAGN